MKNGNSVEKWLNTYGAKWIWVDKERENQYIGALTELKLPSDPLSAKIAIFADCKYKLYINGHFVNSGPAPFWKPVLMIDEYDICSYLKKGTNKIFVLSFYAGIDTKYNMKEKAGLIFSIEATCNKKKIVSVSGEKQWKVCELNCWESRTPRKNWAIEQVEDLDLKHPDFAILSEYASQDYYSENVAKIAVDKWNVPRCFERDDLEIRKRIVPLLRWRKEDLKLPRMIFRGNTELYNWQDTTVRLDHEHVWQEYDEAQYEETKTGIVKFERAEGEPGFLILYDFRRMTAGDPSAEIYVEKPCRLELAMAEDLRSDGRPITWRNGGHYYARYHLAAGLNRIRFYHFNGYRFLYLVFKDAIGSVEIRKVSSNSCRADIDYQDMFSSNDRDSESLYRICRRSIKLNTQAFCYDCNTREQGTYLGDGIWIAESVGHMTGNFSHLRHLCVATNDEIKKSGPLLNASLFGMAIPLLDYCLVPIIALAKYYKFTGDIETVKYSIKTMRAIVEKFREFRNEQGFISQKKIKELIGENFKGFLFLDHQGNGWHPMTTVGLDRRDINSGLNLFYLWALQSLLYLEKFLGSKTGELEKEISSFIKKSRQTFFCRQTGLIADAVGGGVDCLRFSQISNALAIICSVTNQSEAENVLKQILDIKRHTWISMGTPYSYFFIAEAVGKCKNLASQAIFHFEEVFRGHLERGATTTWESWRAENHDSRNHAWSAPFPHLLRCAVAGVSPLKPGYKKISFEPALNCFDNFNFTFMVPNGVVNINWEKTEIRKYKFSLFAPKGTEIEIICEQKKIKTIEKWHGELEDKK